MKFALSLACAVAALPYLVAAYDDKIYGVNLGSWCVVRERHCGLCVDDEQAST